MCMQKGEVGTYRRWCGGMCPWGEVMGDPGIVVYDMRAMLV